MVNGPAAAAIIAIAACGQANAAEIDLRAWANSLPVAFSVSGVKNEPTYLAAIDIWRQGDRITIRGGAPAWMDRSVEAVDVHADGTMTHAICPAGMDCSGTSVAAGFLSTASVIAAARTGRLHGSVPVEAYGPFQVLCIPAEQLAIRDPILDPCFEISSGAAIAQKHRTSHRFDGPSLDPSSIGIDLSSKSSLPSSLAPKENAS
ncbi:MAG: hypothetical protein QM636_18590 [Rhizobium sp.]